MSKPTLDVANRSLSAAQEARGTRFAKLVQLPLAFRPTSSTLQHMLAAAVPSESIHLNHRLIGLSEEPGGVRLQFEREDEVLTGIVASGTRRRPGIRLVHFSPIVVSMITAPRSSPSSGSEDVERRGSRRIHVLREGPISLPATEQRDETQIGRRYRSESDGFIAIARSRRCFLHSSLDTADDFVDGRLSRQSGIR